MSPRGLIAGLPLATGTILISMALLPAPLFEGGAFFLEWIGSFLAFYGLSCLTEKRHVLPLAGVVLVAGSLGDITLVGGLNSVEWIMVNYMVFVHAALGSLTGYVITRAPSRALRSE